MEVKLRNFIIKYFFNNLFVFTFIVQFYVSDWGWLGYIYIPLSAWASAYMSYDSRPPEKRDRIFLYGFILFLINFWLQIILFANFGVGESGLTAGILKVIFFLGWPLIIPMLIIKWENARVKVNA